MCLELKYRYSTEKIKHGKYPCKVSSILVIQQKCTVLTAMYSTGSLTLTD